MLCALYFAFIAMCVTLSSIRVIKVLLNIILVYWKLLSSITSCLQYAIFPLAANIWYVITRAFDLQIIYHFQQYSIRLRYNRKLEAISLLTSGDKSGVSSPPIENFHTSISTTKPTFIFIISRTNNFGSILWPNRETFPEKQTLLSSIRVCYKLSTPPETPGNSKQDARKLAKCLFWKLVKSILNIIIPV